LAIPLGGADQTLEVFIKTQSGLEREKSLPVRFVPMTGKASR